VKVFGHRSESLRAKCKSLLQKRLFLANETTPYFNQIQIFNLPGGGGPQRGTQEHKIPPPGFAAWLVHPLSEEAGSLVRRIAVKLILATSVLCTHSGLGNQATKFSERKTKLFANHENAENYR
jgi:hypothetical protein